MRFLLLVAVFMTMVGCSGLSVFNRDVTTVSYRCEPRDELIRVSFDSVQNQAIVIRRGQEIVLPQAPAGSGFLYENAHTSLRGKGNEAILSIGRMASLRCVHP